MAVPLFDEWQNPGHVNFDLFVSERLGQIGKDKISKEGAILEKKDREQRKEVETGPE